MNVTKKILLTLICIGGVAGSQRTSAIEWSTYRNIYGILFVGMHLGLQCHTSTHSPQKFFLQNLYLDNKHYFLTTRQGLTRTPRQGLTKNEKSLIKLLCIDTVLFGPAVACIYCAYKAV